MFCVQSGVVAVVRGALRAGLGGRGLGGSGSAVLVDPRVGSSGRGQGQAAVAVELEEVVDGALEAPLGPRGGLAA
jgi:hypothetical protein